MIGEPVRCRFRWGVACWIMSLVRICGRNAVLHIVEDQIKGFLEQHLIYFVLSRLHESLSLTVKIRVPSPPHGNRLLPQSPWRLTGWGKGRLQAVAAMNTGLIYVPACSYTLDTALSFEGA